MTKETKNPAAITAGLTIETSDKETINVETVAENPNNFPIPVELASWQWPEGCDRSYVHLVGGVAAAAFRNRTTASVELAYIPDSRVGGDGFNVNVILPDSPLAEGVTFDIGAGEARALANALLAALAFVPSDAGEVLAADTFTIDIPTATAFALVIESAFENVAVSKLGVAAREFGVKASSLIALGDRFRALLDHESPVGR